MNEDIQELLRRFREDELAPEEWHRLNELLDQPEGREALLRDWFLEAALPQSLAVAAVPSPVPVPSPVAAPWVRLRETMVAFFTVFAPSAPRGEESVVSALRLWSRASFAALAIGLVAATWAVWPPRETIGPESDPAFIAQLILQNQLPDAP